ncbi:MAG: helix-turn-helix transcriptional regulator [Candidatus Fimivivens sp.]
MNHTSSVCECILTENEQGICLIINNVTDTFCRVVDISPNCLGMPLEKVVPRKNATWIYQAFSHIKNGDETIQDLREIQGRFWCYSLSYNKPKLTISLSPIWDVDEANRTYSVNNLANISLNKLHSTFYDSILINCAENHFKIESIGPDLSQKLGITIGDNITMLLSSMRNLCTDRLIRRAMTLNRIHYYIDVYAHNEEICYLLVTLIPLNHFKKYMLMGFHKLKAHDYFQIMKSINTDSPQICKTESIGVAVLEIENSNYKRTINANACFNRLVDSHEDFELIRTKIIPVCCTKQTILTASRRLGNLNCLISAIPILNSNQIFLFIIPNTGPQPTMQILANRLTKRELEIACHIINGNSIKGISVDCGITEGTVKKNLSNIYGKLHINNRIGLMRLIFPTVIN